MQIRNDYNSYSGTGYQHSHTHHITECVHGEEQKKNDAGAMGMKQEAASYEKSNAQTEALSVNVVGDGTGKGADTRTGDFKAGVNFLKEAWDTLGKDSQSTQEGKLPMHDSETAFRNGVNAVVSAIRQSLSYHIVNKWETLREKIKVSIHSSLKRFGKGSDAFAALADNGSQAAGEREMNRQQSMDKQVKGTRFRKEEIPTAYQTENHLMDSYTKNGEYCRLGENLTYQKKTSPKRAEKPMKDSE